MIKEFPQFVPQKTCLSCDGCCRFAQANSAWCPKMAREEIDKKYPSSEILLGELNEDNTINTVERWGQVQCTFFNADDHACQVYESRPFECRLYPFLLVEKENDPAVGVHLNCPYVQEKRKDNIFEDHIKSLQHYFQQSEVREFIKRNSMLIGDYPECEQEIEYLFTLD